MPKIKTNRGAAKRFRRTGNGGFKCGQSHRRHILTKKSTKRKRQLRFARNYSSFRRAYGCTYDALQLIEENSNA